MRFFINQLVYRFFVFDVFYYIGNATLQDKAKFVNGLCCDSLRMLDAMNGVGRNSLLENKGIFRYAPLE